jgi:uncharacterized phage-associated protein
VTDNNEEQPRVEMTTTYPDADDLDDEKFENVVLYVLEACPSAGLTKLLKMIWKADWSHYQDHLSPITNAKYVALQRGPVVDGYVGIFDRLERRGIIMHEGDKGTGKPKSKLNYVPIESPDLSVFTESELQTLSVVVREYGNHSGVDLSDMSHEENGVWSWAWDPNSPGNPIPYTLVRWLKNWCDDKDIEEAREILKSQEMTETLQSLEACA